MTLTHGAEIAIIPVVATGALVAMVFTPENITTLTVAVGGLATAVAAMVTAFRMARESRDAAKATARLLEANTIATHAVKDTVEIASALTVQKVAENTALTEKVNAKVDTVGVKVDGTASRAQEQIESMRKELAWLHERLGEQKQDAALLAQAKVVAAQVNVPISATINGAEESLKQIDANTDAIKDNTKKD